MSRLDRILEPYSAYYDVTRMDRDGGPAAIAQFHSRGEKYLLTRSINMWSMEDHEYVFFFTVGDLDDAVYGSCMDISLSEGMFMIHPSSEHRSSTITTIIICDSISQSVTKKIKRHNHHRSFKMTLNGWMDHRVVAVSASGEVVSDRLGREISENIRRSAGNSDHQ